MIDYISSNTYVSTLKTQASLEELQDLVEVTPALISRDGGRQFLGMNDDVKTADLRLALHEQPAKKPTRYEDIPDGTPSSPSKRREPASRP